MDADLTNLLWAAFAALGLMLVAKHGLVRRFKSTHALPWLLLGWLPLLPLFYDALPHWRVNPEQLIVSEGVLWLLVFVDAALSLFRVPVAAKVVWPLRLVFPLLAALIALQPRFGAGEVTHCVVPVYGPAILWSDAFLNPTTWYFLELPESDKMRGRAVYGDPHEGKSVFAPFTGRVDQVTEGGYIDMTSEQGDLSLRIGPLMPDMIGVKPGGEVFANQPLGLMGKTEGMPGVRLEILKGGPLVFTDCLAGRYLAAEYDGFAARRNVRIQSTGKSRFQFQ